MERCKNCKHYKTDKNLGGVCTNPRVGSADLDTDPAGAQVSENPKYCPLMVGPDFGCIHHEKMGGVEAQL